MKTLYKYWQQYIGIPIQQAVLVTSWNTLIAAVFMMVFDTWYFFVIIITVLYNQANAGSNILCYDWIGQIGKGIALLHNRLGIIHRDIKPEKLKSVF